jgi:citrate lyase subunit beta/citryl-CoA lyase
MEPAMLLMRSLLYVPANRPNMVERAHTTPADVIVLDLEDSVPPHEKEAARGALPAAIASLKEAGKTVHVRINHPDTGWARDDVAAAVRPGLDGINFPKTQGARDIRQMDVLLREHETHGGVRPGTVLLIPTIETARGLLRGEEIALGSTRVAGLALGGFDYALDLGLSRSRDGKELTYARQVIVTCSAAYGLQALDTPYGDIEDQAGLVAEAEYVRDIGFRGKYAIHPAHIEPINAAFAPQAADVERARRIVSAFEAAVAQGQASVQVEGQMVDTPVARRARELVEYAEALAGR